MRLEHHLVGGYVRYISPHIIIIIIIIIIRNEGKQFCLNENRSQNYFIVGPKIIVGPVIN